MPSLWYLDISIIPRGFCRVEFVITNFCIAVIFMKYWYTTGSWLLQCNVWVNDIRCSGCSPLGEKSLQHLELLWKGQGCLTKVAKLCPFPCTSLYKSCLFYPSWQATSFERPPSWVILIIEGFRCIMILAYDKWACIYARKHVSSDNMAVDFYNFDLFFNLFVLLGFLSKLEKL